MVNGKQDAYFAAFVKNSNKTEIKILPIRSATQSIVSSKATSGVDVTVTVLSGLDPGAIVGRTLEDMVLDKPVNKTGQAQTVEVPDPFSLPYPLGRIIYEKNDVDENLKYLSTVPEYIAFVNKVQKMAFDTKNTGKDL